MDADSILALQERAKELQCLYNIEKILTSRASNFEEILYKAIELIPDGWQHPDLCYVIIEFENKRFVLDDRGESSWSHSSEIIADNNIAGKIIVSYSDKPAGSEVFLPEEYKLLKTIADRLGQYIFHDKLKKTIELLSKDGSNYKEDQCLKSFNDEHWQWRFRMAQYIADKTDFAYYGLEAMYIIGSTKEATAGPASDIDLLVHFTGTDYQNSLFRAWIDGWNHSLSEFNRQKTGYLLNKGIIDLHLVRDEDIRQGNSFAIMIGNINKPARLLKKVE